jgi:hypothetical protein
VNVEELIERGDAICARYAELEAPLRAGLPKDDSPEAYQRRAELLPQLGALLRQQVAELAELEPPAGLAGEWRDNLARLVRSADLLDARGDAARRTIATVNTPMSDPDTLLTWDQIIERVIYLKTRHDQLAQETAKLAGEIADMQQQLAHEKNRAVKAETQIRQLLKRAAQP